MLEVISEACPDGYKDGTIQKQVNHDPLSRLPQQCQQMRPGGQHERCDVRIRIEAVYAGDGGAGRVSLSGPFAEAIAK